MSHFVAAQKRTVRVFASVAATLAALVMVSACSTTSPAPTATPTSTSPAELSTRALPGYLAPRQPELNEAYAAARLKGMTLEQKIATLVMFHPPGTEASGWSAAQTASGISSLILMGDNTAGGAAAVGAQLAALPVTPGLSRLVGIDQEGGIVSRLSEDQFPSALGLKQASSLDVQSAFAARGSLLRGAGITVNFGIVADVTADESSFIFDRVLGTDPATAAAHVEAAVAGESGQVFSTLKHFPGHGATPGDSHSSVPQTSMDYATWLANDAAPFVAGIEAGAELVMMGHLLYPSIDKTPASLSPRWQEILRNDLGFDGVSITDDLGMLENSGVAEYRDPLTNAIRSLNAGNDILLFVNSRVDIPTLVPALAGAVASGAISQERIDESCLRVLTLERELWIQQHPEQAYRQG